MGGYDLVALVFVREVSDPLTSLVKQLDAQLELASGSRSGSNELGVFIVFCDTDPALKERLQQMIAREGLKHVVLCVTPPPGPARYQLAPEADVTVVVYKDHAEVATNIVLRKGGLDADTSRAILTAVSNVLPR